MKDQMKRTVLTLLVGARMTSVSAPGYNAWVDKLAVLERFNGRCFAMVGGGGISTTQAINIRQAINAANDNNYRRNAA